MAHRLYERALVHRLLYADASLSHQYGCLLARQRGVLHPSRWRKRRAQYLSAASRSIVRHVDPDRMRSAFKNQLLNLPMPEGRGF